MPIAGLRGTGSYSADDRPKNYRDTLLFLKPNTKAPLTAYTGRLKSAATDDPEFKVATKGLPQQHALVSGSQTNSDTTIELQGTNQNLYFKAGHSVINERTMEVVWVTASGTANQLTVIRGKGSTAAAMNDGDRLRILAPHSQEGASTPPAVQYDPVWVTNYTQIFRTSLNLTGTALATRLRYADNPKIEAKREILELHATEIEMQFLFGSGIEDTSGSQPERTTRGLYFWITSNVMDANGAMDIDSFENFLEDLFEDGSDTKILLCGNRLLNVVNKAARMWGTLQTMPKTETFGTNVMEWLTPYGTVQLKQHPLLSKSPNFNSWGFAVDFDAVRYRYLRGRDTQYLTNRQAPGDDRETDEFLTEAGLEMQFQEVHGLMMECSSFVA